MSEKYLHCSMLFMPSIQTTKHWLWLNTSSNILWCIYYMYMWMHCRFVYKGQWREKINSYVDFPTRNLDLNPYLEGPKSIKSSYRLYATSVSFQTKGVLWGFFGWGGWGGIWCYNLATDWLIFVCLCKIIIFKLSSVWGVSSGKIL